jgi:hypothetical protein
MAKKSNHNADIKNPNKGTSGTNITWDKAQGAKGKHKNPNQSPSNNPPKKK